ncbi:MAG: glycosyltransferase family 4 protein [Candidatus Delongbacteria bacterium]
MAENILLINHYAGSPTHGMEFRPFYFSREWQREGHEVHVFAASFSHLRSHNPAGVTWVRKEVLDGVHYHWFRTPTYRGNGLGRILNMGVFLLWLIAGLPVFIWKYRFSVVIASSTYPLDMVPAWILARLHKAKLVFEVHDLWPLSPLELGRYSRLHPFILLMQWGENFAYSHCDTCVSLLPKAMNHMLEHGLQRRKFLYIPNGIDLAEWESLQEELGTEQVEAIEDLRARVGFLLGYVGSHGLANALDTLVEAIAACQTQSFGVVMIGSGPAKPGLMQKAADLGLGDRIIFLPPIPKRQVPQALARMDALYIGWQRTPLYRFGISPNKLFDYMMAGKPILHAIEAGNDPVVEAACGISVAPESTSALIEGLEFILHLSPEARASMGDKGREYVREKHQISHLAGKMIHQITSPRP